MLCSDYNLLSYDNLMPPFTDYLKMWVTKPSSNMIPKKWRSDLTEVSQATPNPVKTIAQGTASTAPLWMNSKIQNLANIPKMSVTKSPFNFTNLIGQQQGWLPNTDFLKMWMQWPTQQGMQEFNTRLDDANTSIKDNKRAFVERVAKWWVITRKEIEEQMSDFDDNKKREFLSVLWQSNAKIEWIDFNNEPKEWFTIGNTDISVNPIKQAGEKILEAKEYLKNNPQADPIMKTILQWIISSFDPTWWLATSWLMQTDAVNDILPKTDNPLTQWVMWFAGNTTRGVWQVIEWGAWLVDKGIAGIQSLVQGWDMSQYQTRQTGIGEDILDVWAGATQSLASLYAMPASLLIGAGIEALPPEWQKAVSDTMTWLWWLIAKTPWLSQWMESLPPERRDEFKAELAWAAIGMLWWLKGKSNIIKNPKLFLQQNLNPVQLAKNFNENVIGIPSKALETAVSTVGKMKIPDVNMPSVKVPKAVSNKVDMVIEQLEWVGKSKKEWIQNNPYSKEIYSKVIEDIDNGNAPQNYKDMQEPYTKKVVEELDTILDDVKSQKWEWGEAFNLLRQDQTPIDTTVEIKSMNDLLKWTDYSLKTFLNRVDKWNLLGTRKILDNTATISTLHDIRKWLDDLMLKAQANKDSWEFKILKNMRKIVDGKLKENPDRVKADEEWARISKDIQEIEEGITYREQRKKWQIRDNIDSIIENINNPAKAKLRERLLQYMPDIWERISAIRGIPEIAKAYTTIPQWVIGRTAGALWWVAIWSTGWIPWMILWGIAWMFADVWLSQLRRNAIKKAIAKQSPKALKKLWEIQKAISDGKKLRAEQVIELQNFTNNLKKSLPANDKELISKVSELPQVMKTSLVPVKEWPLESRWYTQKLTSPKREITEINPMAGKKYTAQDLLQEVRAKKTGDKWNNPKIPANTPKELPANKKLSDNLLTKLNNPKKTVQSDTLVSKADMMEADKLANAQYIKEDAISNIQSIAKKNPENIRKVLQKEWVPDNRIQSFIDDASNGKISERQAKNIRDALGKSDSMSSKGRIDIYAELWDTRATKAYNNARLTNAEVKIKYKKWELKKQDIEDLIRARESNEMDDFIDRGKIIRWPDYNNTLRSLITDDIKPKDNQNIAVNKTEALKKELKWVKSDTLVSKTDSMSNRLNDYKNNQTSNYWPEQKQQSIDRIDYVVQWLRKSESPEDMKRFLSKIDLDDNYRNTFREVALDRKLWFREYFEKFNPHNFEQQMPKELYSKLKNIFIDDTMNINKPSILDKLDSLKASKELQPLYEEAKKYKSADEFIDGLKKKYSTRIDDLTKKQKLYNPDDPVWYNIAKEEYFKANWITKSDINIIENSKVANIKWMEDTYIQYKKRGQDDFADQQRKNIERAKISNSIFNKYDKVLEKRDNYYKKNEKNIMMNANKWMNNEDANFVMMIKNKLPNISQLRRIREEANRK